MGLPILHTHYHSATAPFLKVESLVKKCDNCARAAKSPLKAPLEPWITPSGPWQRVHVDYAGPVNGEYYLVIVDAFSKWPEIFKTSKMTALVTVDILTDCIARYGSPETIVSDNGTQFTSELFEGFCSRHGIKHLTTAPYHPQSNGQAERFVDTLKRSLRKMQGESPREGHLHTFLATYRRTPTVNGLSPAEMFLGRQIRSRLDLIIPAKGREEHVDTKMQSQFDKHHGAKSRRFHVGDAVMYRKHFGPNRVEWTKATITRKIGKAMFELKLGAKRQRAHANQIRHHEGAEVRLTDTPLSILLDSYALPEEENRSPATPSANAQFFFPSSPISVQRSQSLVSNTPIASPDTRTATQIPSPVPHNPRSPIRSTPTAQAVRHSSRISKPPQRLVIDPSKKKYTSTT